MRITFHGAAQTVTGSQHLIEVNGTKFLLDCGLYQGKRKEAYQINRELGYDPSTIDFVLLSHAHIDHSGNIPSLIKKGFIGDIYATPASVHMAELMLRDSGRIQESDIRHVNKKRKKQGKVLFEPLYMELDAIRAMNQFVQVPYKKQFQPAPGVIVEFYEAGHILGSAAIHLTIYEDGVRKTLWFSGDIGRPDLPLLRDPVLPFDADYLLMESTYGDRPHESVVEAYNHLRFVVNQTLSKGGKVIIPAFAVGRTQELVYHFNNMMYRKEIPSVPVFVDSPLAVNITDVFRKHWREFDTEARAMMGSEAGRTALGFDRLTYIRSVQESKELNEQDEPMIIISASGMVETGRVLHHLEHNIHDPRSIVLIVSWQAPYTLGRRLLDGVKKVKIWGTEYDRKIGVERVKGFSAHAGQKFLVDYAAALKGKVKEIFLVHGEEGAAAVLTDKLKEAGLENIHYPEKGSFVDL